MAKTAWAGSDSNAIHHPTGHSARLSPPRPDPPLEQPVFERRRVGRGVLPGVWGHRFGRSLSPPAHRVGPVRNRGVWRRRRTQADPAAAAPCRSKKTLGHIEGAPPMLVRLRPTMRTAGGGVVEEDGLKALHLLEGGSRCKLVPSWPPLAHRQVVASVGVSRESHLRVAPPTLPIHPPPRACAAPKEESSVAAASAHPKEKG